LTSGNQALSAPVEVRPDPRVTVSRADQEAQLALTLELRDELTRIATVVHDLRVVREQLTARIGTLEQGEGLDELVEAARVLVSKLDTLESKLHNREARVNYDILAGRSGGVKLHSRLSALYSWSRDGDGAPTEPVREIYGRLEKELASALADWSSIVETDIPALNSKSRERGLAFVVVPTSER
jgi:hypothetical protein